MNGLFRLAPALVLPLAGCPDPPGLAPAPAAPERIVSLGPSITEVLFAVGAGGRVIGVTSSCDFPAEAAERPRVGGYGAPNVEMVLAARPDLVLVPQEGFVLGAVQRLRALGVRIEPVAVASLDDLGPAIERVAALAGAAEEGRALARTVTARIEAVRAATAGRPRPRALLALDRDPVVAAGPGTFGDDLLRAAGAENVAGRTLASYPQLGAEAILALAPEVIFDAAMGPEGASGRADAARAFWARFASVPAVRDGRVVVVDPDLLVRPGPRLADGLERLAREVHPEAFPSARPADGRN